VCDFCSYYAIYQKAIRVLRVSVVCRQSTSCQHHPSGFAYVLSTSLSTSRKWMFPPSACQPHCQHHPSGPARRPPVNFTVNVTQVDPPSASQLHCQRHASGSSHRRPLPLPSTSSGSSHRRPLPPRESRSTSESARSMLPKRGVIVSFLLTRRAHGEPAHACQPPSTGA